MRKCFILLLMVVTVSLAGCSGGYVDPAELGMIKTSSGWDKTLYKPRRVWIGPWSTLYVVDCSEYTYNEHLEILTADELNLKCTISARCSIDASKEDEVKSVFDRIRPSPGNGKMIISAKSIYDIYGKLVIQGEPREMIGSMTVTEVREKRSQIVKETFAKVTEQLKKTPLTCTALKITNIDWPDAITNAMEKKKEAEIEIEAEERRIQQKVVAAQGEQQVAEISYQIEILEAAMIADANKIIAGSLTPEFLQWHNIKVLGEAARGQNNAFIIAPYDAMSSSDFVKNGQLAQMLKVSSRAEGIMKELKKKKEAVQKKATEAPKK